MKNLKKVLVCVMAVATLSSITCISSNAQDIENFNELFGSVVAPNDSGEWYEENSIQEAVFIVQDGDYSTTYYYDSQVANEDNAYTPIPTIIDDTVDISQIENVITISSTEIDDSRGYIQTESGYRYDESLLSGYDESEYDYLYYSTYMETGDVSLIYIGENEEFAQKVSNIEVEKYDYQVAYFVTENEELYSKLSYNFDTHQWFNTVNLEVSDSSISKSALENDSITIGESEDSITAFTIGDSVYPRGDINLDGKTNTADLLYLKKYLLGLIEW